MESTNPYASGDAAVASPTARFTGEIAGKWRRFGTMLVDYAVYYALCAIVTVVVILASNEHAVDGARVYLISVPVYVVYYALFEATLGRTPGKLVLGTRVVNQHGAAPSFGQVIGRTLSRFIPFEPFSVLFATDGEAIGWHDSIARTKVIRTR